MLAIEQIKQKDNFTALERQISEYILKNRREVFSLSLAELAGRLYMSKATIIRYYKKLGFSSYREMCVELSKELSLYDGDGMDNTYREDLHTDSSLPEIARRLQQIRTKALAVTYEYLKYDEIEQAADMISRCGRIYLYGFGRGGSQAVMNLEVQLKRLGKDVSQMTMSDWFMKSYQNYSRETCMIIVGYNDHDGRIAELVKNIESGQTPIILITGPMQNEIDRYANLILRTNYMESRNVPGSIGSAQAIEYLTEVLYFAMRQKSL